MKSPFSNLSAPGALLGAMMSVTACATDEELAPPPDVLGTSAIGSLGDVADAPRHRRLRDTALGGNSSGQHDCPAGPYEHYEEPAAGETQLHVVGSYTPDEGDQGGDVAIRVGRAGSSVLVLAAYDPTEWVVTAAPGVTLERVILTGYHAQTATVPDGVPVEIYTSEGGTGALPGAGGYQWPSYSAEDLVQAAEQLTSRRLTSFRGCYRSASFDIDQPVEIRPPHPHSGSTELAIVPGCESLTKESTYCITTVFGRREDRLAMFGLDSGRACTGSSVPLTSITASSLGWQGDYIYQCDEERGIMRTSVKDGTADIAPIQCKMVTTDATGLIAQVRLSSDDILPRLVQFASFKQAAARRAQRTFDLDPHASRIAVHQNQAYFAWHSTSEIETARLTDGAPLPAIPLEGYDSWVNGMDVTDDGRLLVAGLDRSALLAFDADTGEALDPIPFEGGFFDMTAGFKCVAGGR